MAKYRKKPVIVDARQWTPADGSAAKNLVYWLAVAGNPEWFDIDEDNLHIRTLEGVMVASPGDWIIRGIKGEFYPCKSDIFEATYERVADA